MENNGVDVKRSKLEGRRWNFDVEMDSGIPGPTLEPRRDEGMPTATAPMEIPTVPPLAPPPEEYMPEIRVHSNSGGGDVAAKMKMVICDSSYADPTKTKVIDRVVRYTHSWSTFFILAERGRQVDRYWPDHHYTEVTGTQERHLRDDGIGWTLCHFQGRVHSHLWQTSDT